MLCSFRVSQAICSPITAASRHISAEMTAGGSDVPCSNPSESWKPCTRMQPTGRTNGRTIVAARDSVVAAPGSAPRGLGALGLRNGRAILRRLRGVSRTMRPLCGFKMRGRCSLTPSPPLLCGCIGSRGKEFRHSRHPSWPQGSVTGRRRWHRQMQQSN